MRLKQNQVRLIAKSDFGYEELAEYGDIWRIVEGPHPPQPGRPSAWRLRPLGGYNTIHRKWVLVDDDPNFGVYQGDEDFQPIGGKREFAINLSLEGRKPAGDLKKTLVAICEEAGLGVNIRVFLNGDVRLVWAEACSSEWPYKRFVQIRLFAIMQMNGEWDGTVEVNAPAPRPIDNFGSRIVTLERPHVLLTDLPDVLRETFDQQRLVIADLMSGKMGPWQFGEAEWKKR